MSTNIEDLLEACSLKDTSPSPGTYKNRPFFHMFLQHRKSHRLLHARHLLFLNRWTGIPSANAVLNFVVQPLVKSLVDRKRNKGLKIQFMGIVQGPVGVFARWVLGFAQVVGWRLPPSW